MRYRVLAPMTLQPGALLGLTPLQAQARSFGLQPQGGHWLVIKPVAFKAGEEIDGIPALPKAVAQAVEALHPLRVLAAEAAPRKAARKASH